jgi:hypothetical protein
MHHRTERTTKRVTTPPPSLYLLSKNRNCLLRPPFTRQAPKTPPQSAHHSLCRPGVNRKSLIMPTTKTTNSQTRKSAATTSSTATRSSTRDSITVQNPPSTSRDATTPPTTTNDGKKNFHRDTVTTPLAVALIFMCPHLLSDKIMSYYYQHG